MNSEELQELYVPHKHLWQDLNVSEVEERKREWEFVKRSLKSLASIEFKGPYLKYHKDLFMKGKFSFDKEDYGYDYAYYGTGSGAFAFSYPFFYIWYLPKIDKSILDETLKHFMSDFFSRNQRFQHAWFNARRLLFMRLAMIEIPEENIPYNFMGGRQKYLGPMLIGEKGKGAVFDLKSEEKDIKCEWFRNPRHMIKHLSCFGVLKGNSRSKGVYNQYIWPQASWYLKPYLLYVIESFSKDFDGRFFEFDILVENVEGIVFFNSHPLVDRNNEQAILFRDYIFKQLESGLFSPELNFLFKLVEERGIGNVCLDDAPLIIASV